MYSSLILSRFQELCYYHCNLISCALPTLAIGKHKFTLFSMDLLIPDISYK